MNFSSDLAIDVSTLAQVAAGAFAWHIAGATRVTVIAKATFEIVPSVAARLTSPEPLRADDVYDSTGQILCAATEMVPHIPNAGIVLSGSAYIPAGADRITVSLGIHRYGWLVHKRVVVPSHHRPPTTEPSIRVPLASAGFGPLSPTASPRREMTPHIVAHPSGVPQVHPNVDFRYFQSAPPDQQCVYLEGDEWIMLEGVHPSLSLVRTQLPSVRAEARLWLPATAESAPSERGLRLVADTVLVDTDRMLLQMVWRGHIEVSRAEAPMGMTAYVGLARPDAPVDFPRRAPRPKPVLAGTTAVSEQEIARSREAAAAPFRVAGPDASRASTPAIPGAPFQANASAPAAMPAPAVPPVPLAALGTVAITPAAFLGDNPQPAAPNAVIMPPEVAAEAGPGRKRPRPVLAQTLEQRDKPPERPIAPFAIADAGSSRASAAPIPGAPFLGSADLPPIVPPSADITTTALPHEAYTPPVRRDLPEAQPPKPIAPMLTSAPAFVPPPVFVPPPTFVPEQNPVALVAPVPPQPPVAPVMLGAPTVSTIPTASLVSELPAPSVAAPAEPPHAPGPPAAAAAPTLRDTVVARARAGASMHDLNLVGADLSDLDLTGARLSQQNLSDVRFVKCKLSGAELSGADLTNVDFSRADLSGADLSGARLMRANLTEARFVGASLERADLTGATAAQACFEHARLVGTNLSSVQAASASFRGASLGGADLRTARCSGANFDGASLENVVAARADFSGARFVRASLGNAALRGARLPGAVLAFANVSGADFRDADLRGANLHRVDRASAKLAGANLRDIVESAPPESSES